MVDISFNVPSGPENTKIVQQHLDDHPELRYVVLVLKYFLSQNRLNEPYWGGMGSYALVLLASFLIQKKKGIDRPPELMDLGALLLEFLRYYGKEFNNEADAICVKCTTIFSKSSRQWFDPANPLAFAIEDPQNAGTRSQISPSPSDLADGAHSIVRQRRG